MPLPNAAPPPAPRGISFAIAEHVAVRSWAAARDLHVTTELDRTVAGEEYEEVLGFYEPGSTWRRLTLWREPGAVVVEPATGPARRFGCIWDAVQAAGEMIRLAPASRPAVLEAARRGRQRRHALRRG